MEGNRGEPPSRQPRRRRWFQYSLRSLFLLTTVVAVWLGFETQSARQREWVIARVSELGGRVIVCYEPGHTEEPRGPEWFRGFMGSGYFARIVDIDLSGRETLDEDLAAIGDLPELMGLNLIDCSRITDAGLKSLKTPKLFSLDLGTMYHAEYHITPDGIRSVRDLRGLEFLSLGGSHLNDTWLTALHGATQLKYLSLRGDLRGDNVTKAGIESLQKQLPQLTIVTPTLEQIPASELEE